MVLLCPVNCKERTKIGSCAFRLADAADKDGVRCQWLVASPYDLYCRVIGGGNSSVGTASD